MTIGSETRTAGPFNGNDLTVAFPFTFKVFTTSDVLVVQADDEGVETTLTLTTNYTVTLNADQDASPGGTVTMLIAPPSGDTLTLTSNVGNLQAVQITNLGGFYPSVINTALDRLTILIQQLLNKLNRSVKFPLSDGTSLTSELPTATLRANKALIFDADGNVDISADNYVDQAASTAGDVILTHADVVLTHADVVLTNADVVSTAANAAAALASEEAAADAVSGYVGDITVDVFTGDGVETEFTLSVTPASKNSTTVAISGVLQQKSTYTLVGALLTFSVAPAAAADNIEVTSGRLAPIATPGDLTVSTGKLQNDAVTYAKIQNVSATSRILGRKTASAGDTEECTLSEILDFVGSPAQGDVLYRNATEWVRLAAGTAGGHLETGGSGANPSWEDPHDIGDYKFSAKTASHGRWLLCEGGTVSRTTYSDLFAVIGTSFGVGDGSTTFTLPDPRGRVMGATGTGTSLTARAIGATAGAETHALTSGENGPHTHDQAARNATANANYAASGVVWALAAGGGSSLFHSSAADTTVAFGINSSGSGTAHNNMQPTLFGGKWFIYAGV